MKLLDVTLRDGGFINDFALGQSDALHIIDLLDAGDLDAIEIGYLTGLPPNHGQFPAVGCCYAWRPDQIAEVVSRVRTPIVGMLHPGGREPLSISELAASGLALVRVPIVPWKDGSWRSLTDSLRSAGMRFTINLTLATWSTAEEVEAHAREALRAGAEVFYVADTNSAFLPGQVEALFRRLSNSVEIPLGFHAHDCKRLAIANVLGSLRGGGAWVDASLFGFGRGAGNAATEVLHEIAGRNVDARHRLLRALPAVAVAFGVDCDIQMWAQLCAFIDLWPPAIELLERISEDDGAIDKYSTVADRLLGMKLAVPPDEAVLRACMAAPGGPGIEI